jgi:hypothetical protein
MNNIYRDHNGYYIRKYFRGKYNSVSGFKTYEEAEKARSSFISAVENGTLQEWKDKFSPKNLKKLKTKNGKVAKNIYKSSKKYIVNKTVAGEKHVELFDSLEEAITFRDSLPRNNDLVGRQFGELTVVSYAGTKQSKTYWHCKCSCGKHCVISRQHLISGHTQSCGHLRENYVKNNRGAEMVKKIYSKYGTPPQRLNSEINKNNIVSGEKNIYAIGYKVSIMFKNETYNLGPFATLKSAVKARDELQEKLWGNISDKWKDDPLNSKNKHKK